MRNGQLLGLVSCTPATPPWGQTVIWRRFLAGWGETVAHQGADFEGAVGYDSKSHVIQSRWGFRGFVRICGLEKGSKYWPWSQSCNVVIAFAALTRSFKLCRCGEDEGWSRNWFIGHWLESDIAKNSMHYQPCLSLTSFPSLRTVEVYVYVHVLLDTAAVA